MNEMKVSTPGTANRSTGEIYIVDDEPMLLELAAVILEPLGYRIKVFRNGEAAISEFKAAQPQPVLIITDYAMHAMNGMELIEECRRLRPGQKTLLLSGTVGPDIFQGTTTQPDRFLAKPYQAKQLIDTVRSLLAE
jgi:CheY-like chemotaxis protein